MVRPPAVFYTYYGWDDGNIGFFLPRANKSGGEAFVKTLKVYLRGGDRRL